MSLDRVVAVLDTLGLRPPSCRVVTVGGTNGKGSCVAILDNVYRAAGYRVGAFTSPHLWRFNERIRVDGVDVTDAELVEIFDAIETARGQVSLTYFEASAVAALLYFAQRDVEIAILEVGMGGRLDAVNAVDADASLIVSVDMDHMAWLGGTREAIGHEKAGIMRSGRPVIVGDHDPPASVLEHADEIGAELRLVSRDFEASVNGGTWSFHGSKSHWCDLPLMPFAARVQRANATACVAVVESLLPLLPVEPDELAAGLKLTRLRGRVERHECDGVEWIFDVAHNPAAARQLQHALENLPPRRMLAVFGAMEDKDIDGVLDPFRDLVSAWFVAPVDDERGAGTGVLVDHIRRACAAEAVACLNVADAVAAASRLVTNGERVLVFGSFHTVGPAMAALGLYSPSA